MLEDLKAQVCQANIDLGPSGLVKLTWGNVSGIDRDQGIIAIKPSGVDYSDLNPEQMVLVDLEGKTVEGKLKPRSDTKTHLEFYKAWEYIGGVTHTHSPYATIFSQAGKALPCYGTTHADHFYGPVPLCRALTEAEVAEDYEKNTGLAIVQHFADQKIDPQQMPAVLQHYHAPFTWGKDAAYSLDNSIALEMCAQMALETQRLNPEEKGLPQHILDKHFLRKHGPRAYYGQ